MAREAERGGVDLPMPEQEVDVAAASGWALEYRPMLPVEQWNAQISLLTGIAAASLMVYGAGRAAAHAAAAATPAHVQRLHRTARALGIDWPAEQLYPELHPVPRPGPAEHAAMVVRLHLAAARRRLRRLRRRGAAEQPEHAALASEYAHVTAPLRRLVDRYAGEICVALCAGTEVPDWVRERARTTCPRPMQESGHRAHQYENAVLDLVEAAVLRPAPGRGVRRGSSSRSTTRTRNAVTWWCASPAVEAARAPVRCRCRSGPTSTLSSGRGRRRHSPRRCGSPL